MKLVPDETPDKYLVMPEGLEGYWWETKGLICIPFVEAHKNGAFSSFLKDICSRGKVVFFPTIISARLDVILRAKGFEDAGVLDTFFGFVDGLALFPKGGV